jgi:hypothetical protein
MVSKSTNEKLKQGIAVRFHGEEGMVGIISVCDLGSNCIYFLLKYFSLGPLD